LEEDLGDDILGVFGAQGDTAEVGGMVDDVINQAKIAVHEIVPGADFVLQAALEKVAVRGRQCHVRSPRFVRTQSMTMSPAPGQGAAR
jgi:hypothetical protein